MMMAMAINPTRPTPITRTITTKHTTINKTTSSNRMPATTQTISSNNNPEEATMMNRGYWLDNVVNAADARQRILQRRCQ